MKHNESNIYDDLYTTCLVLDKERLIVGEKWLNNKIFEDEIIYPEITLKFDKDIIENVKIIAYINSYTGNYSYLCQEKSISPSPDNLIRYKFECDIKGQAGRGQFYLIEIENFLTDNPIELCHMKIT